MGRSRRKADAMAKELLQSRADIDDAIVTQLLDVWRFKPNFNRKNITPAGTPFCHSDTIGLVLSRDGKVFATKAARQFPNFFSVLCRWLLEHGRPELMRNFCFTSICLNYGFAPALHRDCNNYGTSITKAFGQFEGGVLLYWPDDDGAWPLEKLRPEDSVTVDTSTGQLLFDAKRAHMVTPFSGGERYSVVYYSIHQFAKAPKAVVAFLRGCGVQFPTEESRAYFSSLIAPPRGYAEYGGLQQSIRQAFGYEEKKQVLFFAEPKRSLVGLGDDALNATLSMVLTPLTMPTICAVSRRVSTLAWSPTSWEGSVVNAHGIWPMGRLAHNHYACWTSARFVINGQWAATNVSLLMSKVFYTWRWLEREGTPFLKADAQHTIMVSQSPVGLNASALFELTGRQQGTVSYGLCNSREPLAILRKHQGKGKKRDRCVIAELSLGEDLSSTYVSFTYTYEKVELHINGKLRGSEEHDGTALDPDTMIFAVVIFNFVPTGRVIPCWSRRGG